MALTVLSALNTGIKYSETLTVLMAGTDFWCIDWIVEMVCSLPYQFVWLITDQRYNPATVQLTINATSLQSQQHAAYTALNYTEQI